MVEDKKSRLEEIDGLNIEFRIKNFLGNLDQTFPNKLLSQDAYAVKWELKKNIISKFHKIDRLNTDISKEVE
jgi:hypothetical protein